MESRHPSDKYAAIAQKLIRTEPSLAQLADCSATIVYLGSDAERKSKRRLVYAECEKVPAKYRWAVQADFTITVFEPNVERFTDEQLHILLLHELLHVGIERDGNEEYYYIVPHNVEDFSEIIKRYGLNWSE